jgi:hypothetical protein
MNYNLLKGGGGDGGGGEGGGWGWEGSAIYSKDYTTSIFNMADFMCF